MALESFLTNELTPALAQEVDAFLDSQDTSHPFQFPQWADPGSRLTLLREGGRIRWMGTFDLLAPLGWKVPWIRAAVANRGPVCDDLKLWEAAANELAGMMQQQRLAYFEVSPDWIQPEDQRADFLNRPGWKSFDTQRASLRLHLTSSADEIFANFSKNTRYEIRRAERLGATVGAASTDSEIDGFLLLYEHTAARKGFLPESIEILRRAVRWLVDARFGSTQPRGVLLLARTGNIVRGGAVLGRAGRRCWYIWGASEKAPHVNVGHLLQWHALRWAKSQGCSEYDFGGYTPGATSGPAWFKAGFGGHEVRFVAARRRVLRPRMVRVLGLLSRLR
jgi:peptidoglycan pentaglycine glycine transferase (the first glycine)